MRKHRQTAMEKRSNAFLGMTLIEALEYQKTFSNGGELSGSFMKFVYKGWVYELTFENNICVESGAHKFQRENIMSQNG